MAERVEDRQGASPPVPTCVEGVGGDVRVAQVRERVGLAAAVAGLAPQFEGLLVARDRLPVVVEVMVGIPEYLSEIGSQRRAEGRPMKAYEATCTIKADPAVVWAILTDAEGYPRWDSGIERVDGRIAAGEKIKIFAAVSPGRAFPLRVSEFAPGRRMVWSGGMPLGLFRGVRTFTLTPAGGGVTDFRVREEFTGVLLPLIWRSMPDLGPSFAQFAAGLKSRAEAAFHDREG